MKTQTPWLGSQCLKFLVSVFDFIPQLLYSYLLKDGSLKLDYIKLIKKQYKSTYAKQVFFPQNPLQDYSICDSSQWLFLQADTALNRASWR